MNPNHYLAVAIQYLLTHRPRWRRDVAVGKTLVSSSMIDRVVKKLGHDLREVPVGFKWFVPGLVDGSWCFGGEESAGASFLRLDGTVWTTDKDGPSWTCSRQKSPRAPAKIRRTLSRTPEDSALRTTRALTPPPRQTRKQSCKNCRRRPSRGSRSCGRANYREADESSGQ